MSVATERGDLVNAVLPNALEVRAHRHPERPCLQWTQEKYRTYGQVWESVGHLAGGLHEIGVKRGETVLVMLPNGLEILYAWLALTRLGAVEVPVNIHERGDFLKHIVNDSCASTMIVHSDFVHRLEAIADHLPALRRLIVLGDHPDACRQFEIVPYSQLMAAKVEAARAEVGRRDLMAVLYTSGTTGPAKGIMMSYGHAAISAANLCDVMDLNEDDIYFVCMPLFHSNAQVIQVMPALLMGARASIWPEFHASHWLEQVTSAGATVSNTLGVMCEFIYRQPPSPADRGHNLRRLQTIPLPASIAASFEERFGVKCIDGYGLTDVGMVSFRRPDEPLVPGSSGRPVASYEVMIADPESDQALPTGTVGEIMVRPKVPFGFMSGYWRNDTATVNAWRNLWFHTGDAGYLDSDGLLFFHDRLKDSIRVRGENVSSSQVESVFSSHPAVAECSAVAVPAESGDDDIKLCVVLSEPATPDQLIAFAAPRMPYFAVPRYVEVVNELPKTPTGKVRKVDLRQTGVVAAWDRVTAGIRIERN